LDIYNHSYLFYSNIFEHGNFNSEQSSANGMHFNIFYVINKVEKSIKLGSKLALY